MRIIAERAFSLVDQNDFAELSGDANPVHVDAVAARRTLFGAPVVHGVHLLLWALESWLATRARTPGTLLTITADFKRGTLVGEPVNVEIVRDAEEFELRVNQHTMLMTFIRGRIGEALIQHGETLLAVEAAPCRELDFASAAVSHGILPLGLRADAAARLFPAVSHVLPPSQLAALLATTRLVGMVCPGLHSLFSALTLHFDGAGSGPPEMAFQVDRAIPHLRTLRLAVRGPGFHGNLQTVMRPSPCAQASFTELAQVVERSEFSGQRAVVIGGSRGLGEITAKLLAAGGAEVVVTYRSGRADAERMSAEINAADGRCTIAAFDAQHPAPVDLAAPATHLYYFASPRIRADKSTVFSAERLGQFCSFYASGFVETLLSFARGSQPLRVLYPSTVFLDKQVPDMVEYCAAKAAGEAICRQLEHRFPAWRFHAPRLPRMATDQTVGLMPLKSQTEPAHAVLLRELRYMNADTQAARQGAS